MQGEMDTYLDAVGNQIRWKAARKLVKQELQGHIEEKKRDALAKSTDTTEAEHKAVEAMGDPVETGRKLDKLHRPKLDIWMLASIAALIAFGIIMFRTLDSLYDSTLRFVFTGIGLALGITCVFINFRWLLSKSIPLIIMGSVGIIGMLFVNFTDNWGYMVWGELGIGFDGLTFISYISLMFVIIAAAGLASRVKEMGWAGLFCTVGLILAIAALNLFRLNRQAIITLCLLLLMMPMIWASRAKTLWKVLSTVILAAGAVYYFGNTTIALITNPESITSHVVGSSTEYLLKRLENLQWIGQTPGMIPGTARGNTILYVALQFGIIPGILLLFILGVFIWRMIRACLRIKDVPGRILATGLMTFVTALIMINLALNAMLVDLAGSYLPFLSNYGAEYLLAPVILGIILGLYRKKDLYPANESTGAEVKSVLFG